MKLQGQRGYSLTEEVMQMAKTMREPHQQKLLEFVDYHRRMLSPWNSVSTKIQIWFQANPGRAATHDEIAGEIGSSRETVSRLIDSALAEYERFGRSV